MGVLTCKWCKSSSIALASMKLLFAGIKFWKRKNLWDLILYEHVLIFIVLNTDSRKETMKILTLALLSEQLKW